MSLQDKIKNAKETSWPLENWKTIDSLAVLAQGLDCMGDTEHAEDIRQAIDIMRKYQEIQEIIDDYEGEGWERIAVSEIREVIEDGTTSD